MNNKHEAILEIFNEYVIEIPIAVTNSFDDAFEENPEIELVDVYFRGDYELLGKDLQVINAVKAYIDHPSDGTSYNVFTYFGDIEYSVTEFVKLFDGEKLLEDITHIDNKNAPTEVNPGEWAVVVFEKIEWGEGKYTKTPKLIIYCPEVIEEE